MKYGTTKPHLYRLHGVWSCFQILANDRRVSGMGWDVRGACADFLDAMQRPPEPAQRLWTGSIAVNMPAAGYQAAIAPGPAPSVGGP